MNFIDYSISSAFVGYCPKRVKSGEQLRKMRIHGVTAAVVRDRLTDHRRPSPEELVTLRIHGR